jgi:hypothetical protein
VSSSRSNDDGGFTKTSDPARWPCLVANCKHQQRSAVGERAVRDSESPGDMACSLLHIQVTGTNITIARLCSARLLPRSRHMPKRRHPQYATRACGTARSTSILPNSVGMQLQAERLEMLRSPARMIVGFVPSLSDSGARPTFRELTAMVMTSLKRVHILQDYLIQVSSKVHNRLLPSI